MSVSRTATSGAPRRWHALLVGNRFEVDPGAGGTEMLTADLAAALSERRVSVTWLATGDDGNAPPGLGAVTRVRVPVPPAVAPSASWRAREGVVTRTVEDALRDAPPFDVVHVTHFSRLGLGFLDARPLRDAKTVATLTDYTAVCGDYQLVHRRTGQPCAPPVAPGDCAECLAWGTAPGRTDAVEYDDWRSRNVRLLSGRFRALWVQTPHQRRRLVDAGLDDGRIVSDRAQYAIPASWRRRPAGTGIPTLLFLGRASPEKGLHVLLDAFAAWPGSARLRVVTTADDGGYERTARAAVAGNGRVEWLSPVGRDELGDLLNAATALVVPSQWDENHPMVMHYAMALGVPVLCSAVPSLTHLTGVADVRPVEEYHDPASWGMAFDELMGDPGAAIDRTAEFRKAYSDLVESIADTYGEGERGENDG
ncbi:glycosyltransferase [Rhizomonospora bruguierae]|uniref:glycosyltransferase n=1 Tax=Rhizomonospora bruguierae TaxID=1581705 RepID=UPI001BCCE072|nr:glycosyltransferase [Micromonospora sp. NBRC 107566]